MLGGILVMGSLGVVIGIGLALASKLFYVYVDPKIEAVEEALPGANCGGCGLPGCSSNAVAIVGGKATASSCVAGGPDVAAEIASIMGVSVTLKEPEIAAPGCSYGVQDADLKFLYGGIHDCRAADMLHGGTKICPIGCLGLGTCVRACPFGALSMGPDNLPIVDPALCTGCGTCERICPKHIITLSSTSERFISEYVVDECTAPCQRACPTGINIPAFIQEIRGGNNEAALAIIKEKCPLPLICGYICPAPCELECRRNLIDEAIAINPLKRFVSDQEMMTGKHLDPYKAPANGHKIAVVGGGAEGLTTSYYLARLGYDVTIFEAKPELGGILRYVIAEDRLPRKVLDHEIKGILEIGVEAKTNMAMGRDFSVDSLLSDGFDAVVLTKGGFDSRKILQPDGRAYDSALNGVFIMLDFVYALNHGILTDPGKRVVIMHGGMEGLELGRRCRVMGAEKVTLVTHVPLQESPLELQQTQELESEGISVRFEAIVTALKGISRHLVRVDLQENRSSLESPGETESIPADTLIISAGRLPEYVFVKSEDQSGLEAQEIAWETVPAYRTFPGAEDGILSPPEPGRISDSSAVVKSLMSGRRLTRAVHQYFTDDVVAPLQDLVCKTGPIINVTEVYNVTPADRERPLVSDVEGNSKTAWIFPNEFPGLDEAAARKESERCLKCGLICYRRHKMQPSGIAPSA